LAACQLQAYLRLRKKFGSLSFPATNCTNCPSIDHTQFFKLSDPQAQILVLTHADVRTLPFRKQDQRNRDDLRLIAALFD